MVTGGDDDPGCYGDSSSSLRDAMRRNTVSQMTCDSSTRILEHQKNVARCLLLRQERMLRSQLMTRMAEAQRIKAAASNPGQTDNEETCADAMMTSSNELKGLDSTAQEDNRLEVVINPYPITPRPKHGVLKVPPKPNRKKAKGRLKPQHFSLDLDEFPVEQTRLRLHCVEGHSPRGSRSRLPSLLTPLIAPQRYGETGDGVWLGHPEAINSVRRTLKPTKRATKRAEVRLLRRTQSLREPPCCGSSRRGSKDLIVVEEDSKCLPLRSFSLSDDKTGLEGGMSSLALTKSRSSSLRLSMDEVLGRDSLFQGKSWRKGDKGVVPSHAWADINGGHKVDRYLESPVKYKKLPPIASAEMERENLEENGENDISVEGFT